MNVSTLASPVARARATGDDTDLVLNRKSKLAAARAVAEGGNVVEEVEMLGGLEAPLALPEGPLRRIVVVAGMSFSDVSRSKGIWPLGGAH